MSDRQLYTFGEFSFRADENVLHRDGKAVPLTPKMFEMLRVLVTNHGRIVDKDTLFKEVWPDSYVEEGNIAFNIRQLRKALDDDAQSPTYIETVPKRGYRFIADVERIVDKAELASGNGNVEQIDNQPSDSVSARKWFRAPVFAVFILCVAVIAIGSWILLVGEKRSAFRVLNSPFASEKLSTSGTVSGVAISPDGKTVVYSSQSGNKQSIWLRQLDSGNNVPLVPPSEEHYYYEFVFSPDGNSVYFSRAGDPVERPSIYRISILGGIPEKIVSNTVGSQSISPDGEKISFVRCPRQPNEWCSLWIADAKDGNNEKKLLSRSDPLRIADNKFSPDGTKIAFATGQSRTGASEFHLMEYDLQSGTEGPITSETFFNIKNIAWLPDQSGLFITASRIPTQQFRIWHISAASGTAEPLTKDSEAYSILSLDRAASILVSTQIKDDFGLYLFNIDNPTEKRFLAAGTRGAFASDGTVYFASTMSGNDEVWSINPDGNGQRQLTNDPAGDGHPVVSPDSKTVFFTSNRSGEAHVWRMDADGSNQIRITKKDGGYPVFVSPDGKLVYYRHNLRSNLWSVSLENGEEKLVLDQPHSRFALSPDGSMIAFQTFASVEGTALTVVAAVDGRTIKSFRMPTDRPGLLSFGWMPDGKSLIYLLSDATYGKGAVFRLTLDADHPQQIADFRNERLSEIGTLAVSPDGRHFTAVFGHWKHDAVLLKGLR